MKLQGALGEQNETALARLKRALIAQPGFQLIFLEVPEGPIREQVLERVLGWGGAEGVPSLRRRHAHGRAEVVPKLVSRQGGIVLDDIDSALLDDVVVDRFLGAMNWQRDQLRNQISGPLLLVISARGTARMFERAPDLSTWRSHTCRITRFSNEPSTARRMDLVMDSIDPDPIELAHAEAILGNLEERDAPADAVARVWIRVGTAHQRCGELGQARNAFSKAENIATPESAVQIQAQSNLVTLDIEEYQLESAERRLEALEPLLMSAGASASPPAWLSMSAGLAAAKGDATMCLALARRAVEASASRPDLQGPAQLELVVALINSDKLEETLPILHSLFETEDQFLRTCAYLIAADVERMGERPDRAVALLRQGMKVAAADPLLTNQGLLMAADLSGVLGAIGQSAAAREVIRSVEKELRRAPPVIRAIAALNDGIAALQLVDPAAVSLLENASQLLRGTPEEARAQLMLSIARLLTSDRGSAQRAAKIGVQLASASGDTALLEWFQPIHEELFLAEEVPSVEASRHKPARVMAQEEPVSGRSRSPVGKKRKK
jgi:tetratricopeptide (TPR) repeat protein